MVGFLDSPYYIDITPYTTSYKGFQHEEEQKYKYMNTRSIISDECAARYPSSPPAATTDAIDNNNGNVNNNDRINSDPAHNDKPFVNEQWKCQFGQYRLPFVQTSFFMVTSQVGDCRSLTLFISTSGNTYTLNTFLDPLFF